jgi:beta-glucosidase
MFMGLSARLEGEEMDVDIEGFRGGDRTTLQLPKVQQQLIKEIHAIGKPVILVVLSGSAIALNWESQNIPAILHAWYPGQAAGTAIADVIFGDYNPAGRLPVTFYKSVNDLPPFTEYANGGHTYRYFKGDPLYPFGFGLSYTSFNYDQLQLDSVISVGDSVRVSARLTNIGDTDGEEVVQVYVSNKSTGATNPIRSLVGFRRISLKSREATTVEFVLAPDAFSAFDDQGIKKIEPGSFEVSIGGGQPGTHVVTSNVLSTVLQLQ